MSDRACAAKNKAGEPCKANPLKDSEHCLAHDEEARDSAGFGGSQPGAGRPKAPRAVDVLREKIEENIDRVIGPLFDALEAERGLVVGNGASAEVQMVDDYAVRIAAVRELLDRAYGKPKQTTELSGPEGGPIELAPPADAMEKSRLAARLLAEHGLVDGDA